MPRVPCRRGRGVGTLRVLARGALLAGLLPALALALPAAAQAPSGRGTGGRSATQGPPGPPAAGGVVVPDRSFAPLQPEPGDIWSEVRGWTGKAPASGAARRGAAGATPEATEERAAPATRQRATTQRRSNGNRTSPPRSGRSE